MLRYRVMRVHYENEPLRTLFVTQIQFSQMGKDHVYLTCATDEIKLCKTAPKSLFWVPTCVLGFEYAS